MENKSGIYPVDLKVLVRPLKMEEMTEGGIYIAKTVRDSHDLAGIKAELSAVGSQAFEAIRDKDQRPKVGMIVSISKYAGYLIKGKDGKDYRLINDEDIVAVLDGDFDIQSEG